VVSLLKLSALSLLLIIVFKFEKKEQMRICILYMYSLQTQFISRDKCSWNTTSSRKGVVCVNVYILEEDGCDTEIIIWSSMALSDPLKSTSHITLNVHVY
jgi:hypothetical protein